MPVGEKFLLFRNFPAEIRDSICVFVFEETDPQPYQYRTKRSPPLRKGPKLGLLNVSKQTNEEATHILYSKATFHISTEDDLDSFMFDPLRSIPSNEPTFYGSRHLIRYLSICFIPETVDFASLQTRMRAMCGGSVPFKSQRSREMNTIEKDQTRVQWANAAHIIKNLPGSSLVTLTLDVEGAFCPQWCCRSTHVIPRYFENLIKRKGLTISGKGLLPASNGDHRDEDRVPRRAFPEIGGETIAQVG